MKLSDDQKGRIRTKLISALAGVIECPDAIGLSSDYVTAKLTGALGSVMHTKRVLRAVDVAVRELIKSIETAGDYSGDQTRSQ